jgi:hypothetical protein
MDAHESLSITCQRIPVMTALASSTCSGTAFVFTWSVALKELLLLVTILIGRIWPVKTKWGESGC